MIETHKARIHQVAEHLLPESQKQIALVYDQEVAVYDIEGSILAMWPGHAESI